MSVSISKLVEELKERTAWQRTPEPLDDKQYTVMVIRGIKRLYIDTGRAEAYSDALVDEVAMEFMEEMKIDEEAYVLICAQIEFFRRIQNDVNNIVGYTTDALSVTNADKPYAHLQDTIGCLEQDRRVTYYKMIRYAM